MVYAAMCTHTCRMLQHLPVQHQWCVDIIMQLSSFTHSAFMYHDVLMYHDTHHLLLPQQGVNLAVRLRTCNAVLGAWWQCQHQSFHMIAFQPTPDDRLGTPNLAVTSLSSIQPGPLPPKPSGEKACLSGMKSTFLTSTRTASNTAVVASSAPILKSSTKPLLGFSCTAQPVAQMHLSGPQQCRH